MKKLQKFYLVFLSVILVVTLTACNKSISDSSSSKMQASEEVMTFATILHDAKSLNYETHAYTKYLDKLKNSRTYNYKMFSRRGEIIFEPQVFLERCV